jgi:hypothetical protein
MHPQLTQVHIVTLKLRIRHLCGNRLAKRMLMDRVQASLLLYLEIYFSLFLTTQGKHKPFVTTTSNIILLQEKMLNGTSTNLLKVTVVWQLNQRYQKCRTPRQPESATS